MIHSSIMAETTRYRLEAVQPGVDVAASVSPVVLEPGVEVLLGRDLLVNKKEKKVSRKQASVVVYGATVLLTQLGLNPCSLRYTF